MKIAHRKSSMCLRPFSALRSALDDVGTFSRRLLIGACCALVCTISPHQVDAQGRDHDRARQAVRSGKVLPLSQILQPLRQRLGGRVLDAQLRPDQSQYIVKWLRQDGQVVVVTVDAVSGQIQRVN
ncbi:MAG: hypothetical protein ACI8PT_000315 [Gammaproteobacteria bacterium]|jgi:hypothetical protein